MRQKSLKPSYSTPPTKSPEQALTSLMALCARAEKSSGDAKRLMKRWGVEESAWEGVVEQLRRDRFIDDERYAELFIREKSNLNGWGEYKIRCELSRKGIDKEIINERLEALTPERLQQRLTELLSQRIKSTKYTTIYQLRDKLIRYGASRGYALSMVSSTVRELISAHCNEEVDEMME